MTVDLASAGPARPVPAAGAPEPRFPLFRWYPVTAPEPRPEPDRCAGRAGGRTLVLGGGAADRARVCERLAAAGIPATAVDLLDDDRPAGSGPGGSGAGGSGAGGSGAGGSGAGGSGSGGGRLEEAPVAAARALVAATGPVDGVVDLGVGGAFSLSDPGPWHRALRQTAAVLKAVYDDWSAETDATRLFYLAVTRMGGRMGYDGRGVYQPLGGIWAGIAKSLPQEMPNCRVKVVDLEATADPAPYVLRELQSWDLFEIGWREQERGTLAASRHVLGPERLDLGPADAVVLSGGGRGLGFALARELAGRFGCRVLVSGRHRLPYGEEWAGLEDEEFERRERERLRSVPPESTVREVREDSERRRARRKLLRNLEGAKSAGLPIEYHTGDITDPAFVRTLLDAAGPGLRAVIHNAGVATPTRLRNKSVESFLGTVRTKVDGFVALLTALGDRRVDYFCNVGSVSGRLGGMTGQIDYAAANEALARLGFWAGPHGQPVATLCWPTWQRLGLIANFDAALRYADALPVAAGVRLWIAAIGAAEPGEAMVLGRIGRAVSPGQLKGFANFRDHPDTSRLQSLEHYLGEVEAYRPFRSIRARTRLADRAHPCLAELTVGGRFALPAGLVLEYALALGGWVTPEGFPDLSVGRLRETTVSVAGLAGPVGEAGGFELVKAGSGRYVGDTWEVELSFTDRAGRAVLSTTAEYEPTPLVEPGTTATYDAAEYDGAEYDGAEYDAAEYGPVEYGTERYGLGEDGTGEYPGGEAGRSRSNLCWPGVLYRAPAWRRGADGGPVARVEEVRSSDEWTLPVPPARILPHRAVESILQARTSREGRPVTEIRIAETRIGRPPAGPVGSVTVAGSPDLTRWRVMDGNGRSVLTLTGLELI